MDENTIEFWKKKYEDIYGQFDEFQKSSHELEQELELELKQKEDSIKELQKFNHRLSVENDTLKSKLNETNASTQKQIGTLQDELGKLRTSKEQLGKRVRELEQSNDNLEQTNRCAMFSLGEFEAKLNEALERNAILESELDERDQLAEAVQRLRDEARDLKQELAVRQQRSGSDPTCNMLQHRQPLTNGEAVLLNGGSSSMETDSTQVSTGGSSSSCTEVSLDSLDTVKDIKPTETNANNYNSAHTNTSSSSSSTTTTNNNENPIMLNTILNDLNLKHQQLQQNQKLIAADSSNVKAIKNSLSPSARITALNYLHDALRKVTVIFSNFSTLFNRKKQTHTIELASFRIDNLFLNEHRFVLVKSLFLSYK
jgi:DNA repair exonuclease SbcCD ATPase subunit